MQFKVQRREKLNGEILFYPQVRFRCFLFLWTIWHTVRVEDDVVIFDEDGAYDNLITATKTVEDARAIIKYYAKKGFDPVTIPEYREVKVLV